ncbi:phospholipase/Carboxylesterase [Daldinia sp. FL1419]|nr:phospholipase/Carboxylesterase [Daldinia sp. FL1419]
MLTKAHVVKPKEGYEHAYTIILLHGRGSDSEEFSSEFFESEASAPVDQPRTLRDLFPAVRWGFPSSPVTLSKRFGCMESQWFDMWSTEEPNSQPEIQVAGLKQSMQLVFDVVEQEAAILPRDRIFLGGVSQGFAAAYCAYAIGQKGYAGLIGLCSWAPLPALALIKGNFVEVPAESRRKHPISVLLGHSRDDAVIPIEEGRKLRDVLVDRGDTIVEFHEYRQGGHWVNEPQGIDDIVAFLRRCMIRERWTESS